MIKSHALVITWSVTISTKFLNVTSHTSLDLEPLPSPLNMQFLAQPLAQISQFFLLWLSLVLGCLLGPLLGQSNLGVSSGHLLPAILGSSTRQFGSNTANFSSKSLKIFNLYPTQHFCKALDPWALPLPLGPGVQILEPVGPLEIQRQAFESVPSLLAPWSLALKSKSPWASWSLALEFIPSQAESLDHILLQSLALDPVIFWASESLDYNLLQSLHQVQETIFLFKIL